MNLNSAKRVRVRRERLFSAHHLLLANAMRVINELAPTRPERRDQALQVITYSAFALEALANAFGNRFVPRWNHFENAGPLAKLRVIAQALNVPEPDFEKEPWSGAGWLVAYRNKIVHPKPQFVELEEEMSEEEYKLMQFDFPEAAKLARDNFRGYLKSIGFKYVQGSVWSTDKDVKAPICALIELLKIERWVKIYTVVE